MSMRFFNVLNLVLIFVLILGIAGVGRNILNMRRTSDRLREAKIQVESLENKRGELLADKENKKTEFYLEKQIRDKLRMIKKNENLVVLPKELIDKNEDNIYKYGTEEIIEEKKESNFLKWMKVLELI